MLGYALIAGLLLGGPAPAQEAVALPDKVSLTNAVEGHRFANVAAAVEAGDPKAVIDMKGTAPDLLKAICQQNVKAGASPASLAALDRMGDQSTGARLIRAMKFNGQPAVVRVEPGAESGLFVSAGGGGVQILESVSRDLQRLLNED